MSDMSITFCDLCNVGRNFVSKPSEEDQVVDADDSSVILCNGKGYVFTTPEDAIQQRGWREVDYGHQCPLCAAAEDDENAVDEATGAESGATYEPTPLMAAIDYDPDAVDNPAAVRKPAAPFTGKKLRRAK